MKKKILPFIAEVIVMAIMYGVVLTLLDRFFEASERYSTYSVVIQSICFALIFVSLSWLWKSKKKG